MKTGISKIVFLLLGVVILSCSTVKENHRYFRNENVGLLSSSIEITLPIPFHAQKSNEYESVSYFYNFTDSAYIIISQGALIEYPIDRYAPEKTRVNNRRKTSIGVKDNKYWRKDVIDNIRIYYGNVSKETKKMYDRILDSTKISPL